MTTLLKMTWRNALNAITDGDEAEASRIVGEIAAMTGRMPGQVMRAVRWAAATDRLESKEWWKAMQQN